MTSPGHRIFVSHSHLDNDFGTRLVHDLRLALKEEHAVFYDVLGGVYGGDTWWDKIVEELTARDVFLLVLSPDSMNSPWVRREINIALNKNKFILPILHRPCTIRADLETIQIISFLTPKSYEAAFQEVLIALDHPNDSSSVPSKTKEWWVEKGNTLYGLRRYKEALSAYEQAIRLDPTYIAAYSAKGKTLESLKRYEEALAAYEQAIRLDPNDARVYYNKGNVLDRLKRYKEALTAYEQAIRLVPNNARAYNNKGNALYRFKRYEEALAAYEQAIRLNLNSARAYNNKGVALDRLKRYEEALAAYEQAIHLNPKDARVYYNKGKTLDGLKRYEEALTAYERAIELDPNDDCAYYNKGKTLENLKRYEEAHAAYDEFIRLNPGLRIDAFERSFIFSVYDPGILLSSNDTLASGDKVGIYQRLVKIQGVLERYLNTWHLSTMTRGEAQEKIREART